MSYKNQNKIVNRNGIVTSSQIVFKQVFESKKKSWWNFSIHLGVRLDPKKCNLASPQSKYYKNPLLIDHSTKTRKSKVPYFIMHACLEICVVGTFFWPKEFLLCALLLSLDGASQF